jgi:hypothetical protein
MDSQGYLNLWNNWKQWFFDLDIFKNPKFTINNKIKCMHNIHLDLF